jgi:hypothetical protein
MWIWFEHEKAEVACCVKEVPGEDTHWGFKLGAYRTWAASLLVNYLNEKIRALMQSERRKYYELGWKEAKAKKRGKRTEFFDGCKESNP